MQQTEKSLLPFYKEIDLTGKELWREYRFPGNEIVRLEEPVTLIISDNGHRIVTADGMSHYIPYGWIHLSWEPPADRAKNFICQETIDGPEQKEQS